ncbi:MAG: hypothetical protein KBE09_05710 [Candidatus Pacebacteria bacterium]|nr:hypothetical protein [Candidatus Paceibacterota bacterium]
MKKVTVDLDQLLADKVITAGQYPEIEKRAQAFTMNSFIQFALGICMICFVAAAVALDEKFEMIPYWSGSLIAAGILGQYMLPAQARMVAQVAATIGTIAFSGWVLYHDVGQYEAVSRRGDIDPEVAMQAMRLALIKCMVLCFVVGVAARNLLLIGLAVIAVAPIVNMSTMYGHATYVLVVERPFFAAATYLSVAAVAAVAAQFIKGWGNRVAMACFGVALFMVNMALWVGSLWGDRDIAKYFNLGDGGYRGYEALAAKFAIAWALVCLAAALWAYITDKRSVVNLSCTFLAINLYTQWWERLAQSPSELLVASAVGIVFLLVLWFYNNHAAQVEDGQKKAVTA